MNKDALATRLGQYISLVLPDAHGHQQKAVSDFVHALVTVQTCCQAALARVFDNFEAASKRLSRLLHNARLETEELALAHARALVAQLPLVGVVRLSLDWTTEDTQHLLVASVRVGGRAIPLFWRAYADSELKARMTGYEQQFVRTLFGQVLEGVARRRFILTPDRWFADVDLLDLLDEMGVSYVIRTKSNYKALISGQWRKLGSVGWRGNQIANAKNGVSSYEIHRALDITQKSAWFLLHRIRLAMQTGTFEKMSGTVEADETFIGGLSRFMHRDVRDRKITGTGGAGKAIVMGLLERHGDDCSTVRTQVILDRSGETIQNVVRTHVEAGSDLMTDAHKSYRDLADDYFHQFVDHAEKYVDGQIHTNGMENFWTLLKRSIKGTYVSVEPFHLFRYLDEQSFRFNERKGKDADRFVEAVKSVSGRRLTYEQLTGEVSE